MDGSRWYRCTLDVQRRSRDGVVVHYMFNGGVDILSLCIRCSTKELRCCRCTWDVQRMSRDSIVVYEMLNGRVDVVSRDGIVIHETFNGGVEMVSLYLRRPMEESRFYRNT
ncbi:hypothetical protein Tco_0599738 [Tanacetum coccineum]